MHSSNLHILLVDALRMCSWSIPASYGNQADDFYAANAWTDVSEKLKIKFTLTWCRCKNSLHNVFPEQKYTNAWWQSWHYYNSRYFSVFVYLCWVLGSPADDTTHHPLAHSIHCLHKHWGTHRKCRHTPARDPHRKMPLRSGGKRL